MSQNRHRPDLKRRRRKPNPAKDPHVIGARFVPLTPDMLDSPAWRVLNRYKAAVFVRDRIMLEWARHPPGENGRLKVTHKNCVEYGARPADVADGLAIVEALGFIKMTKRGKASFQGLRYPSEFGIIFRPIDNNPPTHNWRRFRTIEEAQAAVNAVLARREDEKKRNHFRNVKISKRPKQVFSFAIQKATYDSGGGDTYGPVGKPSGKVADRTNREEPRKLQISSGVLKTGTK